MRHRLIHKARSERGASLSMSLMLLLVCTIIASVVITAASASVGRISQLRESDKSYYNVTSAAELMWSYLSEKDLDSGIPSNTVTITRYCDKEQSLDSYEFEMEGNSSLGVNEPFSSSNASLFEIAACDLLFGTQGSLEDNREVMAADVRDCDPNSLNYGSINYTFTIGPPTTGDDPTFAPVTVNVKCDENGYFTFEFSDTSDPSFVCTLTASVYVSPDVGDPSFNYGKNRYERETTVSWTPISLSRGGAV